MDETTKKIIELITQRHKKPVAVPGGRSSAIFYDCAQLSPNDLARLAAEAVGHLSEDSFDIVVGIAYRGILFAAALAGGRPVAILEREGEISGPDLSGKKVLIADDVVFSGEHILSAQRKVEARGGVVVGFACIVDRTGGKTAEVGRPLWSAFEGDAG